MASSSVQFRSLDTVLQAYLNRNCSAWSLWQGNQFMFKYEGSTVAEGEQALLTVLEMLRESSNAVYTLRVYEEYTGRLNEKTASHGSFNFKLNDENQLTNGAYISRISALEKRLEEREKDKDEEEEEDNDRKTLGQIQDILQHPIISGLASKLFGINYDQSSPNRAINGVPDGTQDEKINKAIPILKHHDYKLGDHLEKLAHLATAKPNDFNYLLSLFDGL